MLPFFDFRLYCCCYFVRFFHHLYYRLSNSRIDICVQHDHLAIVINSQVWFVMSSESENMDCSNDDFYKNAQEYWAEIPPTVDGMLGGFSSISDKDIKGSKLLLRQLFRLNNPPGNKYALDCGAGIGRVTKHLLIDLFDNVDLVEQNSNFVSKAKAYIGNAGSGKLGNLYSTGLQSFKPDPGKYDVIWMQWVLGHLTDSDLVQCFNNCKEALKPNGVIVVKENITSSGTIEMDKNDSSFTRPISSLKKLFEEAGLHCFKQLKQHDFPKCLYPVYMFVLRPKSEVSNGDEPTNNVTKNIGIEESGGSSEIRTTEKNRAENSSKNS